MRFGAWLAQQTQRFDPVGDLARDFVQACPCSWCEDRGRRPTSIARIRDELAAHNASWGAVDALDRAVEEWGSA